MRVIQSWGRFSRAFSIFTFLSIISFHLTSHALPAFALREKVSCVLCHSNGSAPHLTRVGYDYRRAGFRFPADIGNVEKDAAAATLTNHMAVGASVDYHAVVEKLLNGPSVTTNDEINFRELAFWPLIGAFQGNFAAWTEFDMSPEVAASPFRGPAGPGSGSTSSPGGGIALSQADLRYVWGNPDLYYNVRVGIMAPEGYGASDQWLDDGANALMDKQSAQFKAVDTLVTPLGAMQSPQMGVEVGFSQKDTYITLGIMNGFDGTNGLRSGVQSSATAGLTSPERKGVRDYKLQLDQMFGDTFALTGVYYKGKVSLLDPSNTLVWQNDFSLGRLYFTYFANPSVLEFFAGVGNGHFGWVNSGSTDVAGTFESRGGFVGGTYYLERLTLSAHFDQFYYAYGEPASPKANQYTLMAGVPYENNMFVFHLVRTDSELIGLNDDFRAEWRLLF